MVDLSEIVEKALPTISVTPTLVDVYAKMYSDSTDYTEQELAIAMRKRLAQEKNDVGLLNKPVIKFSPKEGSPKLNGLKWGLPRREHNRKMGAMTEMRLIIIESGFEGVSKTHIFKKMRRDNGHWRVELGGWLEELMQGGFIKRQDSRYFDYNTLVESREQMIHRLVFESLSEGSLTMSAIANKLGYGGGKSRLFIKAAIQDLSSEGFIVGDGIRWKWAR